MESLPHEFSCLLRYVRTQPREPFKMKACIILFAIAVAVAAEKRTIFERCRTDDDCGDDRCCVNGGLFRFCSDKLDEGDLCTIRSKLLCGCKDGLECQRSGLLLRQCIRVSGSGYYPSD